MTPRKGLFCLLSPIRRLVYPLGLCRCNDRIVMSIIVRPDATRDDLPYPLCCSRGRSRHGGGPSRQHAQVFHPDPRSRTSHPPHLFSSSPALQCRVQHVYSHADAGNVCPPSEQFIQPLGAAGARPAPRSFRTDSRRPTVSLMIDRGRLDAPASQLTSNLLQAEATASAPVDPQGDSNNQHLIWVAAIQHTLGKVLTIGGGLSRDDETSRSFGYSTH